MKLNTRSRYALMGLIDLVALKEGQYRSLKEIAASKGLSAAYMEQLFFLLGKKGILGSLRGAKGGYRLTKKPTQVSLGHVIKAVDDPIVMTRCKGNGSPGTGCMKDGGICSMHSVWAQLEQHIWSYLNQITLSDLASQTLPVIENNFAAQTPSVCAKNVRPAH